MTPSQKARRDAAHYAKSSAEILRGVNCPNLNLYRGEGYWYFIHDDGRTHESESVYTMRLNDMTVAQWVEIGVAFVKRCGGVLR